MYACYVDESVSPSDIMETMSSRAMQKSDAQWEAAEKLTAQAAEQSRIAQSRTTEAVKFNQTAEEAQRAAKDAHKNESEIEVPLTATTTASICFLASCNGNTGKVSTVGPKQAHHAHLGCRRMRVSTRRS